MLRFLSICFLLTLSWAAQAQDKPVQAQVDSLKYVVEMPYICSGSSLQGAELISGCGDPLFWNVVRLKEKAIPYLLNRLDDTTSTESTVPNFGGNYTVADIAYSALEEIIHRIPTFKLMGKKFDERGCGYCMYWNYLRMNVKNRQRFKKAVEKWYMANQHKLVWVTSNSFSICDCGGPHPNGGHYELKK